MISHIQDLIDERRYHDASALAIHLKLTYEARELFSKDSFMNVEKFDAFENLLLADADKDFDVYNRFLDYRQPLRRNLYLDRRKYLKQIADEITKMYNGDPDAAEVLRIKLRTRSAKSEFFNRAANWVQGKRPSGETLYCVGGGNLRDNMFEKRVAFIDEYWHRHTQVFPEMQVHKTSKEYASVWFEDREYAGISTVTVGGSIEGWVQATNMLILDDLVASSEINSAKRLEDIYSNDILNAIMRRYISGAIIIIGTPIPTLTGVKDPSDAFYENRKQAGFKCKQFSVPSLDENEKSNYAYRDFSVDPPVWRFTTDEFRREKKAAYLEGGLAKSTFNTVYQMMPMEFGAKRFDNIKFYENEPSGKYREITILDPADAGSDFASCVHGRIYNDTPDLIHAHDVFYDNRAMDREVNGGYLDDLVKFFIKNDIHLFKYEANMGGTLLGETLVDIAKEMGWHLEYETFKQTKNKTQRILDHAMKLIEVMRFKKQPDSDMYLDAMVELSNWTEKAKHDDFTDCVTLLVENFIEEPKKVNKVSFFGVM